MRAPRIRRRRWLTRPIAILAGVLIGLGALGGATGAVLGGVGAFASHEEGHGPGHGPGFHMRHDESDNDDEVPQAPPAQSPR